MSNNSMQNYSPEIKTILSKDTRFGRMNDPSGSAYMKGLCGDEMEFYLVIEKGIITEVKYFTEGCEFTRACAAVAAGLVDKQPLKNALSVSAGQIMNALPRLPENHKHRAILAVITLYKAVADYLLKP